MRSGNILEVRKPKVFKFTANWSILSPDEEQQTSRRPHLERPADGNKPDRLKNEKYRIRQKPGILW